MYNVINIYIYIVHIYILHSTLVHLLKLEICGSWWNLRPGLLPLPPTGERGLWGQGFGASADGPVAPSSGSVSRSNGFPEKIIDLDKPGGLGLGFRVFGPFSSKGDTCLFLVFVFLGVFFFLNFDLFDLGFLEECHEGGFLWRPEDAESGNRIDLQNVAVDAGM